MLLAASRNCGPVMNLFGPFHRSSAACEVTSTRSSSFPDGALR
jgi:hypothetical protein